MKYNAKYDRWFTKGGLVFRYDAYNDKLVECAQSDWCKGYPRFYYRDQQTNEQKSYFTHRAIWETFVAEIPSDKQIDHINAIRNDNRLINLRCVSPKENMHNPITEKRHQEILRARNTAQKGLPKPAITDFGKKYKNYTGLSFIDNPQAYRNEYYWYKRHGHCRWEVLDEHN